MSTMSSLLSRAAGVAVALALTLAQPGPLWAQSATAGAAITGHVTDTSGKVLPGADIQLSGPQTAQTVSGPDGAFTIPNAAPGIYQIVVRKPSFTSLTRSDITVTAGSAVAIDLVLAPLSFTSLQTIGTTTTTAGLGTAQINSSPASIVTVSGQSMADQDVHQVNQILNEIPGIITTPSANSTNIAGGILSTAQVPQIRGALQYETESLIDGHPVSVGYLGYFSPLFIFLERWFVFAAISGSAAN